MQDVGPFALLAGRLMGPPPGREASAMLVLKPRPPSSDLAMMGVKYLPQMMPGDSTPGGLPSQSPAPDLICKVSLALEGMESVLRMKMNTVWAIVLPTTSLFKNSSAALFNSLMLLPDAVMLPSPSCTPLWGSSFYWQPGAALGHKIRWRETG